jgi:diguanylate cyclase (GGDEF)-like protein/PAS domain S-box-containing protein
MTIGAADDTMPGIDAPAMKLDDTPPRTLSANPAERLVDAIDLPIGRWGAADGEARLLFCNVPYTRWACKSSAELVGRTLSELYGPQAWAAARDAFAAAFAGRAVYYERRLTHQGPGATPWVRVQVFPDRNAEGIVEAVYTIGWDIHQDVMEREQLLEARRRLDRFTEHIPYPLTYVDREYRLRFVNLAYQQAVRLPAAALLGRPIGEVRGPARWAQHQPYFDRALAGETVQYTRLVADLPQGPRWLRTSYVPDFDDSGAVQGAYTVTIDVHDLTEAQQRLARSAERDALTDALSRRTMMERIDAATATCDSQAVALFFIDLDGFKALNDTHGHGAGDALLVALARALQQAVRADDAVGRFGGDEFLVLAGVRDAAGADTLASHLLDAVRDCAAQCQGAASVSASIGYALAPQDATQPLRLLQLADGAMYAAKHAGKNRVMRCSDLG